MMENFVNKKIIILGFGREGQDSFLFLRKIFPDKTIGIADQKEFSIFNSQFSNLIKKDKHIKLHFGKNYLNAIKNYDTIIKSPGIPFKIIPKTALKKITTQTKIFFENCPGKIIGVTGTKGKSTTASLIYAILKKAGLKAHLVGNIGKPVLMSLPKASPNDIFVYELSSHQLMNLRKSPHIAVFLNVYPEHLDYYKNFQEYANAKANITKYQTKNDFLIYNSKNEIVRKIAKKSTLRRGSGQEPIRPAQGEPKKIPIKGKYYKLDMEAARKVGEIFKIPKIKVEKAIREFKFLPHRLEYVGKFKGIRFYNDSLSTIPETTIEALNFLGKNVQTLILGGHDRGLDFTDLAKKILKNNVETLILFPATGERIWKTIVQKRGGKKFPKSFFMNNMKEAIILSYRHTDKGKICLLSPASPSFGIFKDYKERGDLFKKWVKKFGKKQGKMI